MGTALDAPLYWKGHQGRDKRRSDALPLLLVTDKRKDLCKAAGLPPASDPSSDRSLLYALPPLSRLLDALRRLFDRPLELAELSRILPLLLAPLLSGYGGSVSRRDPQESATPGEEGSSLLLPLEATEVLRAGGSGPVIATGAGAAGAGEEVVVVSAGGARRRSRASAEGRGAETGELEPVGARAVSVQSALFPNEAVLSEEQMARVLAAAAPLGGEGDSWAAWSTGNLIVFRLPPASEDGDMVSFVPRERDEGGELVATRRTYDELMAHLERIHSVPDVSGDSRDVRSTDRPIVSRLLLDFEGRDAVGFVPGEGDEDGGFVVPPTTHGSKFVAHAARLGIEKVETVIFDLVDGSSTTPAGTFLANTAYDIYIIVHRTSSTLLPQALIAKWSGAENLDSDDKIIFVPHEAGDLLGPGGAIRSSPDVGMSLLRYGSTASATPMAVVGINADGSFVRWGAGAVEIRDLWDGAVSLDLRSLFLPSAMDEPLEPINDVPAGQTGVTPLVAHVFNETNDNAISVGDEQDDLAEVELSVENGVLNVVAGDATITGNGSENLTVSGTQAQINAALASLTYMGTADDTLTVASTDAKGFRDKDTVSIDVTEPEANVAPTTTGDGAFEAGIGASYVLTREALSATDVGDGAAELTWRVTSEPGQGRIALGAAPATAIASFTQAQLAAGEVVYVHTGDGFAADRFKVQVEDDGSPPLMADAVTVDVEVTQVAGDRTSDVSGTGETFVFVEASAELRVEDFVTGDKIDLSTIDADTVTANDQEFDFLGTVAFTDKAGELRYEGSGSDVLVQGDVDGDGTADLELTVTGVSSLTSDDFDL